jgi:post-segregation antitoxin (ccd killing protein)
MQRYFNMEDRVMDKKNRVRWTTSVDPDLLNALKKLSEETRITVSKLTDEAIQLLLQKHEERHN